MNGSGVRRPRSVQVGCILLGDLGQVNTCVLIPYGIYERCQWSESQKWILKVEMGAEALCMSQSNSQQAGPEGQRSKLLLGKH